jgi:hypothetical protein
MHKKAIRYGARDRVTKLLLPAMETDGALAFGDISRNNARDNLVNFGNFRFDRRSGKLRAPQPAPAI